MYSELDEYADRCIRDKGWSVLTSRLKRVRNNRTTSGISSTDVVPPGKVRGAIAHLLGLDVTSGIDLDMLKTFRNLKPTSLRNLHALVLPIAMEKLQEQIRYHNTFFMDIEKMSTTAYAVLVQDIVESRNSEILSMNERPSVGQVLSSYYGYSILTLGTSVRRQYRWEAPEAAEALKELTKSLGATVHFIQTKPVISAQKVFHNCSKETANLLSNIARMSVHMGYSTQMRSMAKLRDLGDSRAVPYLLSKLEKTTNRGITRRVRETLINIGHEDTIGALSESHQSLTPNIIRSISRVRSEKTIQLLDNVAKTDRSQAKVCAAIWGLGNLYATDHIATIEGALLSKKQKIRSAALAALLTLGSTGQKSIIENLDAMLGTLGNETYPHKVIGNLARIPKIRNSKEFIQTSVSCLVTAYEKMMRREKAPSQNYWERRRLMRQTAGSTPQQLLEALSSVPKFLTDPKAIDIISRSRPMDLAILLIPNRGISSKYRKKIVEILADRVKGVSNPLTALNIVADWPFLMKEPQVSTAVLSRRKEIAKALYSADDIVSWLWKVVKIPELDKEGIVANAFLKVVREKRIWVNNTSFPNLVLSLKDSDAKNLGNVAPEMIVNALDDPWVYEAVLAGNLQDHPIIKEGLVARIDTTLVEILRRGYRYADWSLKPWLMEEIAIHINEMENPKPLINLLRMRGYVLSKSAFTRTPRIEAKA